MKMRPEHFLAFKSLIMLNRHKVPDWTAYEDKGLSETRWMWDHVWAIPHAKRRDIFVEFYEYLNDTHIHTALKKILK